MAELAEAIESVPVAGTFCGQPAAFGPKGQPSAIAKQAVAGPVWCGPAGLDSDAQADRKHHGGAEQAVHLMPAEHYAFWAEQAPDLDPATLQPGLVGENLSTRGLTEGEVCLADQFALGEAELVVTCPRAPCWKLGRRLGAPQLVQAGLRALRLGWYFAVAVPGYVQAGDRLELVERPRPGLTVAEAARLLLRDRDDPEALARMAGDSALAAKIRRDAAKLAGRG